MARTTNPLSKEKLLGIDYKARLEVVNLEESSVRLFLFGPGGEFLPRLPILSPGMPVSLPITLKTDYNKLTIRKLQLVPPSGDLQGTLLMDILFSFSESGIGNYRFTGSAGTWLPSGEMFDE